ncbi:MAG TPA: phosphoenolpyruvate synthase [Thiobacillus sp.]|nr:phosphoenolpyruvate synthase [Thiobacillus sp.]
MPVSDDYIVSLDTLSMDDVPRVGGKNASLGEMIGNLSHMGVKVPGGFATTAQAFWDFLDHNDLRARINARLAPLDVADVTALAAAGAEIRAWIEAAALPPALEAGLRAAYAALGDEVSVAVRSSATAEDLPDASFAGQQETYLHVRGADDLLRYVRMVFASLYNDRAIAYRVHHGFAHADVALSAGVQRMVRSDIACSGVLFTLDTESGFRDVVFITAAYGLGETVVQGSVNPDEFYVHKPMLAKGYPAVVRRELGGKATRMVWRDGATVIEDTPAELRRQYSLSDAEVLELAKQAVTIEQHYKRPMDVEWAKDGETGEIFIVQARPETVKARANGSGERYVLDARGEVRITGRAIGQKIGAGEVRLIASPAEMNRVQPGDILVTDMTDPDWEPIMKIASAIVTDKGGRTSHAAIVSRELGIPCIVGTNNATKKLKAGRKVTVDCSASQVGSVYDGIIPFKVLEHRLNEIPKIATKIMVNIGSPDEAFKHHNLPAVGVGLGRLEFIIASHVRVHPNALIDYKKLRKGGKTPYIRKLLKQIDELAPLYKEKAQFYVDELALGIAKIAATFFPHEVIIRFSDFKTNEYRTLIGGELYEPHEENPMLGWRGASRYYDPKFKESFGLECKAMKRVREEMGFTNVVPMIPFCRTPEEGKKVIEVMAENGLDRAKDKGLKIYVMCEIPSNILLADEFLEVFDGMSIGSNDLTQLTLGLDRDSGIVTHIANENNPAVKKIIAEVIHKCIEKNKYIGICGQAPSDYPDFAQFLVKEGIESMSLNPDTVIKIIMALGEQEKNS